MFLLSCYTLYVFIPIYVVMPIPISIKISEHVCISIYAITQLLFHLYFIENRNNETKEKIQ